MVPFGRGRTADTASSVESEDITILIEPARAKATPKCFHSLFLPGHRTPYLQGKGKEDVVPAGRPGLKGERPWHPRSPRGSSTASPTLPYSPLGGVEVGEGWKPRAHAAEADARRRSPSNSRPAPSRPAWRGGAGKQGWGGGRPCHGSASAAPDAVGAGGKPGFRAPRGRPGGAHPPPRLQLRPTGD